MTIKEMFLTFYWNCCRHETEFGQDLKVIFLKRFQKGNEVHEANEVEFNQMLTLCRLVASNYPEALKIDQEVSYHDPLEKKIGKHNLAAKLPLRHYELENFYEKLVCKPS